MPSGTGQTVQAPVPASIVVGFSDDVPAWLLRQVDILDTGNGTGLGLAVTAANAIVASAQNPGCKILILRGTIDLDAASAPTAPYSVSNGVVIEGEAPPAKTAGALGGVQILGRTGVNADQGIFACSGNGQRCGLRNLDIVLRQPTGATTGATTAIQWGTSASAFLENVTISCDGTLDATEAGNLDLRTMVSCSGRLANCGLLGGNWKIRQFVAADFTLLTGSPDMIDCVLTGGDINAQVSGTYAWIGCAFGASYGHSIIDTGNTSNAVASVIEGCTIGSTIPGAVPSDGYRLDPAATNTYGPIITGCFFVGTSGASPGQAVNILSTSSRTVTGTVIDGCQFNGSYDTMIVLGANATSTVVGPNAYLATGTVISDAGINTSGCKNAMTWRGTFIAGAGATTAYAGMGEANAEMLAANAQKRFPATPGVAFRLRVQVISNSMPANTVFTVMLDTAATALTVTVGAAATGQFVDTDSVVFAAAAAASFTTWDLRVVETGVGTIVFSATLELI